MVRICNTTFPENTPYQSIFDTYPFLLSDFQKYAIQGIEKEKHVLITAHTGSGKTLPAKYAIQKYHKLGKKIIYTAPIKSLSNQKMREFTEEFPNISFGILNGDIKFNPEADCLIMTTEILRNTLFQKKMIEEKQLSKDQLSLYFEMDLENELGCVIFDEVHYINDRDRGKVWEETIMMLPQTTLMVMLSATIDRAEKFAKWVEEKKEREVWLAPTNERVVPLSHYGFYTMPKSKIKEHNKYSQHIPSLLRRPLLLREHHHLFQRTTYDKMLQLNNYLQKYRVYVKNTFVLNEITNYLFEHGMLPAICFVFSRKKVEQYASIISKHLNQKKMPKTVKERCKQILMGKLSNYKEYLNLPEYNNLVQLIEKGVAIHHAGIIPVLREMVEILFSEGYIKLLFATETFAVGIDMPTKTVLFTSLQKFDGQSFRFLLPHEYTQMAGRAGRRGKDKTGTVIHLNNLFRLPTSNEYKNMLCGKPQRLESKFQIHFNLILRLISIQDFNFEAFIKKSMLQEAIQVECDILCTEIIEISKTKQMKENLIKDFYHTPREKLTEYKTLFHKRALCSKKEKRKIYNKMEELKGEYKHMEKEVKTLFEIDTLYQDIQHLESNLKNTKNYVKREITKILGVLMEYDFIDEGEETPFILTNKGQLAANIQELHCLVFADILNDYMFEHFNAEELICILSCFTDVSVPREERSPNANSQNISNDTKKMIQYFEEKYYEYENIMRRNDLENYRDDEMQFELCELMYKWCTIKNETECQMFYQELKERNIFLGEFIKAILKINNIANELEKVCTIQNNIKLLSIIKQIPELTLKNVATNQSLYL